MRPSSDRCVFARSREERPAELALQELDGPRERRLRDVAALGSAREVQLLGDGEEVADLVHLHRVVPKRPNVGDSVSL